MGSNNRKWHVRDSGRAISVALGRTATVILMLFIPRKGTRSEPVRNTGDGGEWSVTTGSPWESGWDWCIRVTIHEDTYKRISSFPQLIVWQTPPRRSQWLDVWRGTLFHKQCSVLKKKKAKIKNGLWPESITPYWVSPSLSIKNTASIPAWTLPSHSFLGPPSQSAVALAGRNPPHSCRTPWRNPSETPQILSSLICWRRGRLILLQTVLYKKIENYLVDFRNLGMWHNYGKTSVCMS